MFKNLKLSTKITAGFGIVTLFLVIVGITGYISLNNVIDQVNAIERQVSIVEKTNTALSNAQNAQAGALRYDIYREDKYNKIRKENADAAVVAAKEAQDTIRSPERKAMLGQVITSMQEYQDTCEEQNTLRAKRNEAAKVRATAGATLLESIKEVIASSQKSMEEKKQDVEGMAVTNWNLVQQTMQFQRLRNSYNRLSICAYQYQAAISPAEEEVCMQKWLAEIDSFKKMLDTLQGEVTDADCLKKIETAQKTLATYQQQVQAYQQANSDLRELQLTRQQPAAKAVMNEAFAAQEGVYKRIKEVEAGAQSTANWANSLIVAVGFVALVLSAVIAFFLIRSITKPIIRIASMLTLGAEQTTSAAGQVSSASQSLAQGASEQAASLEETTASMEEMASMTNQNADNASQAKKLAEVAWSSAEKGTDAMGRMSDAIDDIKRSSDETAKIIKTIDEIAFQTNLLALNAAVEAARAGEAGKGFAVVAEEVRNLAQRSAEAARSTSDMIADSVKNADNGVAISREVAEALGEIAEGSRKVNDLVGEIAAASNEQSQGIDQINKAVSQMDQVTQANAASAEESASAAEELSAQAEELSSIVEELQAIICRKPNCGEVQAEREVHRPRKVSSSRVASTSIRKQKCKPEQEPEYQDAEELITLGSDMELAHF